LSWRNLLVLAACGFAIGSLAQTRPKKASSESSAIPKHFCQEDWGFCFDYPASWTVLGEAFGSSVVVAPQQKIDRNLWDEVTVAFIVPPPAEGEPARTIDQIIDTAMGNMRASGHNPATMQRQERTVDGLPAQMIKVRYHDDQSRRDWIEQLVFVEGPEQEIYSIALKAQPGTLAKLEPAFDGIVRSWKLLRSENAGPPTSPDAPANPEPVPHN